MSNIYHDESAPLWLHIMGGILGAIAVLALLWFAYGEYQERKAQRAIIQMQQQMQAERAQSHQRRLEIERMKIQEQQRQERQRQLSSPECRFWTNHYRKNMTQSNLDKMMEYCPE